MEGSAVEIVVVGVAAFLTSTLSAIAGLGGGVILLAVLAQFSSPTVAIPIHGSIQVTANFSRAAILRSSIDWPVVGRASLLVFPASILGVWAATSIPEDASRAVLAIFVLVLAWRPDVLTWRGRDEIPVNALVGVGAVSGFLNTTVGASGPVTSPFFKLVTATHTAFVATAGAAQVAAHASKIAAFGLDGFSFRPHLLLIAVGTVGVTAGSWLGSRVMVRTSEVRLRRVFQGVLTVLALRMLVRSFA